MPQLYSYIRWSSGLQEKGRARTRLVAAARAYAAEDKLEVVAVIEPGLSAFRGKNRKGKVGDFIDAVKSGGYFFRLIPILREPGSPVT